MHALGVIVREHPHLTVFHQLEGIHKADARERQVLARELVVQVLEVQAGDVVGQQHHLVAVKFVQVLVPQRRRVLRVDLAHHAQDEVARTHKRVKDVYALVGKTLAEVLLQGRLDAPHHEVHDRLWRIHDAVRIGNLYRKALEELLVHVVQERLLLGIIVRAARSHFQCFVESVKGLQEVVNRSPIPLHQRCHHRLKLVCDRVLLQEARGIEDRREDASRE